MVETLNGQVAIVTGGARGIGRGIALELARRGARVVVADNGSAPDGTGTDSAPGATVSAEIQAAGGTAVAAAVDVTSEEQVAELVADTLSRWGRIDVLVNVAGNITLDTVADSTLAALDAHLDTHVRGMYLTARAVAPHWMERGYGRMINFSSVAGLNVGFPALLSYSTAKAAVLGLTKSCANFLASYGVTANCICPAADTRMGDSIKAPPSHPSSTPSSRPRNDPANVAPIVAYLASPGAGHVTGRVFGATRGRYSLYSEPAEEAVVELLADEAGDALDAALAEMCANLSLKDLPMPAVRVGDQWRPRLGLLLPVWDGTDLTVH
ncbi:MAG TPA: SDR family NAD(P)-dependent oxidoreductase [Ilumatobacteraceae bacterium]|jgi:NAD(P)-dependent dehydrogenase (short-subunit alcohol dehydrogenase family)